jgi:hypothetical protein
MVYLLEHDDLFARHVIVDWTQNLGCSGLTQGSFGSIYCGILQEEGGHALNVVVKVSARLQHVTSSQTSDEALNKTLRYNQKCTFLLKFPCCYIVDNVTKSQV